MVRLEALYQMLAVRVEADKSGLFGVKGLQFKPTGFPPLEKDYMRRRFSDMGSSRDSL